MLLTVLRQFNGTLRSAAAIATVLALGTSVRADEIHRWRDADGHLHVEIVGGGPPVDPDAEGLPMLSTTELSPEEKFSVRASLERRSLEGAVAKASAEVARLDGDIARAEAESVLVYTPPTARSQKEAQLIIDAQRNAFLAARQFEQDKEDRLRRLRGERRERLLELRDLWRDFERLRAEVRDRYGEPPGWWRDRLDCPGCLSAEDVARALGRRPKPKPDGPSQAGAAPPRVEAGAGSGDEPAATEPEEADSEEAAAELEAAAAGSEPLPD